MKSRLAWKRGGKIPASRHFPPAMTDTTATRQAVQNTTFAVLFAIGFCHMLNDMMQALLPAIYPSLKQDFHLSFTQIGLITLAYPITASLLQPMVGYFSDKKPRPYSLATGHDLHPDRTAGCFPWPVPIARSCSAPW